MDDLDVAYYRQRAIDERYRALEASRSNVAVIHMELAKQYQALVDQAELRSPLCWMLPSTFPHNIVRRSPVREIEPSS